MGTEKGGNYERDLCKRFGLWWTQDLTKPRNDIFWRTSQSGGRATQRAKKGAKTAYQYGDMTFIDPLGKPLVDFFMFEFKKGYNDTNALDIIDSKQKEPLLIKFWNKAESDRKAAGRPWSILILKRDYMRSAVVIDRVLFAEFENYCGIWKEKFLTMTPDSVHMDDTDNTLVIIRLDKFLDWLSPNTIEFLQRKG